MTKPFKKFDAIAAAMLIATAGMMALADTPVDCGPATVTVDGVVYKFPAIKCPKGHSCGIQVTRNDQGAVVSVGRVCIAPPTPIE